MLSEGLRSVWTVLCLLRSKCYNLFSIIDYCMRDHISLGVLLCLLLCLALSARFMCLFLECIGWMYIGHIFAELWRSLTLFMHHSLKWVQMSVSVTLKRVFVHKIDIWHIKIVYSQMHIQFTVTLFMLSIKCSLKSFFSFVHEYRGTNRNTTGLVAKT